MGRALILETTFLIDLDREERRGQPGPAVTFLEREPDARLYVPSAVVGELAGGPSSRDRDLWIAATAVVHKMPLVTRNAAHFRRVPDLELETY